MEAQDDTLRLEIKLADVVVAQVAKLLAKQVSVVSVDTLE